MRPTLRHIALAALYASLTAVPGASSALEAPARPAAKVPKPAASVFLSPKGSDRSSSCTQPAPCLSFDRAYRVARPGEIVEVAGGRYASQEIRPTVKSGSARVIFRPAPGSAVEVGEIDVYGAHVEIQSMQLDGWYAKPGANDVTFRNVRTSSLFINSANNIRVIGGSVGPGENFDSQIGGSPAPVNILIDGVYFHDWTRTDDSHVECLQFGSGINVTIRNSRFANCATHDVFVRSWGPGYPLRNWVVENNVFDRTTDGYYTFKVNGDLNESGCGTFLIRYNSAIQAMHAQDCPGGVTFIGNLGPAQSCYGTFASNVWYGPRARRCNRSDRIVRDPRFVDARALNLRLQPTSPAINRGDSRRFPTHDITGQRRPLGGRPDAGAFEIR